MDAKFIFICGLLLALLSSKPGPARAGDRAQAGSEAALPAAPFSSRAGYVAFWKQLARARIAEEEIGRIFALIPGRYDSSGLRRILLSLFYLGDMPVHIPAPWLLELLAGLIDPAEMAFLFGRSLIETISMFGLKVEQNGEEYCLVPIGGKKGKEPEGSDQDPTRGR